MMRYVIAGLAALLALCTGLVVGARALGQGTVPTPTYLEPGTCNQPCWHGLIPGVDRAERFLQRVSADSPYAGHATSYDERSPATQFELSTYGAITLADVLRLFGLPERVGCLGLDHSALFPGHGLVTTAQLYFADGLVMVEAVRPDDVARLSPGMRVRVVRYFAPGEPTYPIGETTGWHGFASTGTYLDCHPWVYVMPGYFYAFADG